MKEKGDEIEGEQQIEQILLSMAEIMFKIIPFRFQRIVVFILYFPATSSRLNEGDNGSFGDRMIGGEGMTFPLITVLIENSQIGPVYPQRIFALFEGDIVGKPVAEI